MPETEEVVVVPTEAVPSETPEVESAGPRPVWSTALKTGKGLTKPRSKHTPVAEAPKESVAMPEVKPEPKAEVPSIVAPVAPAPVIPPVAVEKKERVIEAQNDDDLIMIPGQKPMTVRQYKADRGKMQDLDRKQGEVAFREQQLAEQERRAAETPIAQTQPAPTPVADKDLVLPPRPQGAIEGDDDYIRWQSEVTAAIVDHQLEKRLSPITTQLNQTREEQEAARTAQARAQQTYQENDVTYGQALMAHLPFDARGLSDEAYQAMNARIRETLVAADPNYDILDKAKLASYKIPSSTFALAIKASFPPGSLPPGYGAPVAETPSFAEEPLIPATPAKPLPNTTASSSPPKSMTQARQPGGGQREGKWMRVLSGSEAPNPVVVRHSGG